MKAILLLLVALQDPSPIEKAARKLGDAISPSPPEAETTFHEDFLKEVEAANLARILSRINDQLGPCTSVEIVADEGPWAAIVYAYFGAERERRLPFTITIDRAPPHLITGMRFDAPRQARRSIDDAVEEIRKFRGSTSFVLARLGESPMRIAAHNADKPMAVGSAFKLAVLGALLSANDARDAASWAKTLPLREDLRSFGSGALDSWKAGAPLTVYSLAALMVSQSDNTATDHLMARLGRARVEEVAAEMGLTRNKPLPTTLEAFKLKSSAELRKKWVEGDEEARRALLDGPVKAMPREDVMRSSGLQSPDTVEWFATAQELCAALDWLRKRTETVTQGRDILSVNPGARHRKSAWKFIGFKGGSEPGVLSMTYLLQNAGGTWYALATAWNDPKRPLDEGAFADVIQDIIYLLQRPAE